MKKLIAAIGILTAVIFTAGCESDNSSALAGHWVEKTAAEGKHPRMLDIAVDDGTYRVDEAIYLNGEYKTQREIGQPVSKTVLSVKNGLRNIRLENGVIFYRNAEFVKAS